MRKRTVSIRRWLLVVLVTGILVVFVARLMEIQIINAETYKSMMDGRYISTQVVKAARGEIVDRSGNPLTVNRMGYDVIIDKAGLVDARQNDIILSLIQLFEDTGEAWNDPLPISMTTPFSIDGSEDAMNRLRDHLGVQSYTSAEDAMHWLVERYGLEDYSPAEQRRLAGVRYDMEQKDFAYNIPYTIASDIDIGTVVLIKERSWELAGVDVVENPIRQYAVGDVAPHVIGTVGPIYREEWEDGSLKEQGYYMDDIIGKDGVEKAFEAELRGEYGVREIHIDSNGEVLRAYESVSPTPGNTVVLTIDSELQRLAQDSLERQIRNLQQTAIAGQGREADAGAVVVLDVKTGEVLAAATYPSYNLLTYREDYQDLVSDTVGTPLVNRALQGEYAPGSTFKPTVALAGMQGSVIDRSYVVTCQRVYPYGYRPTCLSYHGGLTVTGALRVSCNIFFYDTGRRVGIDAVDSMARQLGLGEPTGIEVREGAGQRSNPETKQQIYGEDWYEGDTLQSSIGQLYHQFTPLQLANYAATIANRGTRMKVTIVHEIRDYAMDEVIRPTNPQVELVVDAPADAFETVVDGMVQASSMSGTAWMVFGNYPITVASKTGTPETADLPNSTFITFAPAQDPEIAIAVVIEKGWHGYTGAPVARDIYDHYFGLNQTAASSQAGQSTASRGGEESAAGDAGSQAVDPEGSGEAGDSPPAADDASQPAGGVGGEDAAESAPQEEQDLTTFFH